MSDAPEKDEPSTTADEDRVAAMVRRARERARADDAGAGAPANPGGASGGGSDTPNNTGGGGGGDGDEPPERPEILLDEVDLRDALRGALRPPPGAVAPQLLNGVQRKLRLRSRGKFYGDGWSTTASPRSTYIVTSALMLVLIIIVLLALMPWSSATLP